jgi:D-serine deaminase-like pyridoxal phosphate-dependent protein
VSTGGAGVPRSIHDVVTPALVVDAEALEHNLAEMARALPGARCRPHVKAHKTTALARRQHDMGHPGFTCATPREMVGLARAGLGADLLLANEVVDPRLLAELAHLDARITIAVDSDATIETAARSGIRECVVDVNVGLPRCGCAPDDAGRLADLARARGIAVRGVMGYEGHVVGIPNRATRESETAECMELLARAHQDVGGDIVSAGGTGTYDCNRLATEIQAGSYALMDTAYAALDLPFRRALFVLATLISVNQRDGYAVADCGLKALGMDHGNPSIDGGAVWFCSDEHVTFSLADGAGQVEGASLPTVGDRIRVWPAHVDPTVAYHERMHVAQGDDIADTWAVDLRGW